MKFNEIIEALKGENNAKINQDTAPEEIEKINKSNADLDSLVEAYNSVVEENAKYKDTIVRMVTTEGSGNKPKDDVDGSKPKTIEECIAEELNKKGEK